MDKIPTVRCRATAVDREADDGVKAVRGEAMLESQDPSSTGARSSQEVFGGDVRRDSDGATDRRFGTALSEAVGSVVLLEVATWVLGSILFAILTYATCLAR